MAVFVKVICTLQNIFSFLNFKVGEVVSVPEMSHLSDGIYWRYLL